MDGHSRADEGGPQFSSEDPSDEADRVELHNAINSILENTLGDKEGKEKSSTVNSLQEEKEVEENGSTTEILPSSLIISTKPDQQDTQGQTVQENKSKFPFSGIAGPLQSEVSSTDSNKLSNDKPLGNPVVTEKIPPHETWAVEDVSHNNGVSNARETSKSLRNSPRKLIDRVSLNRESEIIRKKKELLKANESTNVPKKRGRPRLYPATDQPQKKHRKRDSDLLQKKQTEGDSVQKESAFKALSVNRKENTVSDLFTSKNFETDENDDTEFYLPDGWLFYANKRNKGISEGKFDQYYWTPGPKRHKLRSRQELRVWMKDTGVKLDVEKFFCTQKIETWIQKGILKFITDRCVIPAKSEEEFSAEGRWFGIDNKMILNKKSDKSLKCTKHITKASPPKSMGINVRSTRQSSPLKSLSLPSTSWSSPLKSQSDASSMDCEEDRSASSPLSNDSQGHCVKIHKTPKIFKSPYFTFNDGLPDKPLSLAAMCRDRNDKEAPPRSPFNLIQEDFFHNPWQLLVSTIFLNCTSGKIAIPLATEFLSRWSTPQHVCRADIYDILDLVEPLGFGRTRTAQLIRFSHEFLTKDWKYPNELYGIGKYGNDSFKIFCLPNEWKKVDTDDPLLMMYLNWRRATEHLRKKFLNFPQGTTSRNTDDMPLQSESYSGILLSKAAGKSESCAKDSSYPSSKRGRKRRQ